MDFFRSDLTGTGLGSPWSCSFVCGNLWALWLVGFETVSLGNVRIWGGSEEVEVQRPGIREESEHVKRPNTCTVSRKLLPKESVVWRLFAPKSGIWRCFQSARYFLQTKASAKEPLKSQVGCSCKLPLSNGRSTLVAYSAITLCAYWKHWAKTSRNSTEFLPGLGLNHLPPGGQKTRANGWWDSTLCPLVWWGEQQLLGKTPGRAANSRGQTEQ